MYKPLHVFLVDDDADDREIFSDLLQESFENCMCCFAEDGFHALKKIEADSSFLPHFIFIDINMPRMNGMECLAELRKIPRLSTVPIYIYSTSIEREMAAKCLNLGAAGVVMKKSDLDGLRQELREIFLNHKSRKSYV
jgi:CheY-like chemotaxis protein